MEATITRVTGEGTALAELSDGRTAYRQADGRWIASFVTSGGYGMGFRKLAAKWAAVCEAAYQSSTDRGV